MRGGQRGWFGHKPWFGDGSPFPRGVCHLVKEKGYLFDDVHVTDDPAFCLIVNELVLVSAGCEGEEESLTLARVSLGTTPAAPNSTRNSEELKESPRKA